MNTVLKIVVSLSVLVMMISCDSKSPLEKRGDIAYKSAQKLQGEQKRLQLKKAYIQYNRAIKENPAKVSPKLRNHFIEMAIVRLNMVVSEGAVHMDAVSLLQEDIEKFMTPEVTPELHQQYAMLLLQMADSSSSKEKFDDAINMIDHAAKFASDPAPIMAKKQGVKSKVAQENFEIADGEYNLAKGNKDEEGLVKAEFYCLTALYFDSTHAAAKKLLSTVRKENIGTYSAYLRVIDPIPDSTIFPKINKYDILLAMPTMQKRGGTVATIISIYNNSWGALKAKAENFALVDVNGKKYTALSARLTPEMLDQEIEAKYKLSFPAPSAEIEKLTYTEGQHLSEKFFR